MFTVPRLSEFSNTLRDGSRQSYVAKYLKPIKMDGHRTKCDNHRNTSGLRAIFGHSALWPKTGHLQRATREIGCLLVENLDTVTGNLYHKYPALVINVYRDRSLERLLTLF